jgi:hypothetical protein
MYLGIAPVPVEAPGAEADPWVFAAAVTVSLIACAIVLMIARRAETTDESAHGRKQDELTPTYRERAAV